MTDPIAPPRELMEQWASEKSYDERDWLYEFHIATRAAQWGADQELEACCKWLIDPKQYGDESLARSLRSARRPRPPGLVATALEHLEDLESDGGIAPSVINDIRCALEALPE